METPLKFQPWACNGLPISGCKNIKRLVVYFQGRQTYSYEACLFWEKMCAMSILVSVSNFCKKYQGAEPLMPACRKRYNGRKVVKCALKTSVIRRPQLARELEALLFRSQVIDTTGSPGGYFKRRLATMFKWASVFGWRKIPVLTGCFIIV